MVTMFKLTPPPRPPILGRVVVVGTELLKRRRFGMTLHFGIGVLVQAAIQKRYVAVTTTAARRLRKSN
jgi:hypothetical protein